jgi:hypothetical protein
VFLGKSWTRHGPANVASLIGCWEIAEQTPDITNKKAELPICSASSTRARTRTGEIWGSSPVRATECPLEGVVAVCRGRRDPPDHLSLSRRSGSARGLGSPRVACRYAHTVQRPSRQRPSRSTEGNACPISRVRLTMLAHAGVRAAKPGPQPTPAATVPTCQLMTWSATPRCGVPAPYGATRRAYGAAHVRAHGGHVRGPVGMAAEEGPAVCRSLADPR